MWHPATRVQSHQLKVLEKFCFVIAVVAALILLCAPGLPSILCTVLALFATSSVVVMWVSRLAYSLCSPATEAIESDPSSESADKPSVMSSLCLSIIASSLIFHGKLLGQRPLFTIIGGPTPSEPTFVSRQEDDRHIMALHTQYNDYLRCSSIFC